MPTILKVLLTFILFWTITGCDGASSNGQPDSASEPTQSDEFDASSTDDGSSEVDAGTEIDAGPADAMADLDSNCNSGQEPSSNILDQVEMLIVTDLLLQPSFEVLAEWKREKGVPTEVVTVQFIEDHATGEDSPAKVRDYIRTLFTEKGLRYILLGGDADVVPYREVHSNSLFSNEDDFASDFYYSDLDGSWDENQNGIYGEVADQLEMHPDVAVGRAPVETTAEAEAFISRVLAYEQSDPGCAEKALFISEDTGYFELDSAMQLDPLAENVFPGNFLKQKLYWKYANYDDAQDNTLAAQENAINEGRCFVTHYGHSTEWDLNSVMSADDAGSLNNAPYFPIYVSCGCWAGNFPNYSYDTAG